MNSSGIESIGRDGTLTVAIGDIEYHIPPSVGEWIYSDKFNGYQHKSSNRMLSYDEVYRVLGTNLFAYKNTAESFESLYRELIQSKKPTEKLKDMPIPRRVEPITVNPDNEVKETPIPVVTITNTAHESTSTCPKMVCPKCKSDMEGTNYPQKSDPEARIYLCTNKECLHLAVFELVKLSRNSEPPFLAFFLAKKVISGNLIEARNCINAGGVKVNKQVVKLPTTKVNKGDFIEVGETRKIIVV